MRSGLDGRAASSTDQGGGTAGLALLAFAAIAVQPAPPVCRCSSERADTAEVFLGAAHGAFDGGCRMPVEMTDRRFPPPWSLEEHDECFIVRDADGQALGYFYFDEEQQSPAIDRRLTRDDARRMAVNFAKLPDLVASRWLA
jgi:hypothetical protein